MESSNVAVGLNAEEVNAIPKYVQLLVGRQRDTAIPPQMPGATVRNESYEDQYELADHPDANFTPPKPTPREDTKDEENCEGYNEERAITMGFESPAELVFSVVVIVVYVVAVADGNCDWCWWYWDWTGSVPIQWRITISLKDLKLEDRLPLKYLEISAYPQYTCNEYAPRAFAISTLIANYRFGDWVFRRKCDVETDIPLGVPKSPRATFNSSMILPSMLLRKWCPGMGLCKACWFRLGLFSSPSSALVRFYLADRLPYWSAWTEQATSSGTRTLHFLFLVTTLVASVLGAAVLPRDNVLVAASEERGLSAVGVSHDTVQPRESLACPNRNNCDAKVRVFAEDNYYGKWFYWDEVNKPFDQAGCHSFREYGNDNCDENSPHWFTYESMYHFTNQASSFPQTVNVNSIKCFTR
ncbi:hypothetical protein K458DRAFT_387367 [Lentithecium fluviatile CBS 122367]|uniref:Uncharacterized protein n=1 Tax=Lentithecium fluviatile CBS 122367 TaxID=1168545 RepID=A0A6G1J8A9_9PLEO|nr:hypothetical protein K458DRAFT_387367 [Lentithecium fluviatile CBS 122367]